MTQVKNKKKDHQNCSKHKFGAETKNLICFLHGWRKENKIIFFPFFQHP